MSAPSDKDDVMFDMASFQMPRDLSHDMNDCESDDNEHLIVGDTSIVTVPRLDAINRSVLDNGYYDCYECDCKECTINVDCVYCRIAIVVDTYIR